jgi:hypothetical protein
MATNNRKKIYANEAKRIYLGHQQRVLHPNDPFGFKQQKLAESTTHVLRDRVFNEKNKGQKERNRFYASMGPVSQGALEFADSYFSRNLSNKGPAPAQREFRTYLKNRPGELKGGRTSRKTRKVLRLRKRRQTKRR